LLPTLHAPKITTEKEYFWPHRWRAENRTTTNTDLGMLLVFLSTRKNYIPEYTFLLH
jgi:hypothetical protein